MARFRARLTVGQDVQEYHGLTFREAVIGISRAVHEIDPTVTNARLTIGPDTDPVQDVEPRPAGGRQ